MPVDYSTNATFNECPFCHENLPELIVDIRQSARCLTGTSIRILAAIQTDMDCPAWNFVPFKILTVFLLPKKWVEAVTPGHLVKFEKAKHAVS
uniref:Uncharacterized protein n=1 Tax=Hyaloperonospora arabidopsidis (strain Emoy2) TaxID=559515 RepID=M4BIJ4_HYAAE